MDYVMAFLVGGAICAVGQLLMDLTSLTSAHCLGALLSGLGLYEPLVKLGGAGATIPLTGFGHAMVQGIFEEANTKGVIGILSGAFKNTTTGIVVAIVLGITMALIFNPKG